MPDPNKPACLPYWHLWTDDDGISRQTLSSMAPYTLGVLGPNDSPQWSLDLIK